MEKRFGWTGKILRINLTNEKISEIETDQYKDKYIGGRGIASRLYWENISSGTSALDPGNHLFFMTGPLAGTKAPASSRWIVLGKSPLVYPEKYAFGNLGGWFGAALKWVGLDGLDVLGKAPKPIVLVISEGGISSFEDAGDLWGRDALETIDLLKQRFGKKAEIATIGRAGELKVRFASIVALRGASAGKGFGAVMGSKNLKAIVIKSNRKIFLPARPDLFAEVRKEITSLWKGETSERYWTEPVLDSVERTKITPCFSCPGLCGRGVYADTDGKKGFGKNCASAYAYAYAEQAKSGTMGKATFAANRLANQHGLCTNELNLLFEWVPKAEKAGLISKTETGLDPELYGTCEWIEKLIDLVINRQGIGDVLAEGSRRATKELGAEDLIDGLVSKYGFHADLYGPRLFISLAPIHATEPVHPITQLHAVSLPMVKWMIWMSTEGMLGNFTTEKLRNLARTFWGSEKAAEFDSTEYMGAAAAIMQNRAYAEENMICCDFFWPIDYSCNRKSGTGNPDLEARLFSAVTGQEMDEASFLLSGERSLNLSRAIYMKEGRQGRKDDLLEEFNFSRPQGKPDSVIGVFNPEAILPGKDGETFSVSGKTVNKEDFNKVMDDYYKARGWDLETGLFKKDKLEELGLADIIDELGEKVVSK